MRLKEAYEKFPYVEKEHGSLSNYFRFLATLCETWSASSIRTNYYRQKRLFVTTAQKLDKHGNITSQTQKLQAESLEPPKDHEIVRTSTNLTTGQQWVMTKKIDGEQEPIDLDTIKDAIKTLNIVPINVEPCTYKSNKILRVIYTDVHVAMETNKDGYGLYGGVWNKETLNLRKEAIIKEVLHRTTNAQYSEIHLVDLGDYMDGWDGMTVRRGHDLPQNMSNKEAFKAGLEFKVQLYNSIAQLTKLKVATHNITNSNHSNDFDYIVNYSAKEILSSQFTNCEYFIYQRFINHYVIGNHCFILSHGKDSHNLKFGFKPFIDSKGKEKITEYIKHHNLEKYFCTFEKGDSHQQLFDNCTMDRCDYHNYTALSPASEWVQTNFVKGRSGFTIMEVDIEKNEKTITPIYFDWERGQTSEFGY